MKLKRWWVQVASAIVLNSYYFAPWLKRLPCPTLNCYACPLAVTACPIGSLQYFVGSMHQWPLYVGGVLLLFGLLLGRGWCGWVCPFGFLQDLLAKIRGKRIIRRLPVWATSIKYIMLFGVVGLAAWWLKEPIFCKLCPAGTLEAGIPQVLLHEDLRELIGWLFVVKIALLVGVLVGSIYISRFFCQVFCPLGALFGLFNRLAFYQVVVEQPKCNHCGLCQRRLCPTGLEAETEANNTNCIKCGDCRECPQEAVDTVLDLKLQENGPVVRKEAQAQKTE